MSTVLQVVLGVSIATVTVFLVMLLIQARRTAASVQRFAESAALDLHQVAQDVHEVRMRVEEVSDLAKGTLGEDSLLTQVIAGIIRGLPGPFGRWSASGRFFETLLTGIQSALHLFRGRAPERPKEESHE